MSQRTSSESRRVPPKLLEQLADSTVVHDPNQTISRTISKLSANETMVADAPIHTGSSDTVRVQRRQQLDSDTSPGTSVSMSLLSLPLIPRDGTRSEHPYSLIEKFAEGGMGEIWRAKQTSLNRTIVVKRSKADHKEPEAIDAAEHMFTAEAVITASLQHPNITPVHDIARDRDGHLLLAMKEIKGMAWSKLLHPDKERDERKRAKLIERAERLSQRDHLRFFQSVCDAMAYAHAEGIIHRDLKPEQVMIGDYGEVILLDWGLGMRTADAKLGVKEIAGTPAYMAPEMTQLGAPLDERTDIYLLGGILYEILTQTVPHDAPDWRKCIFMAYEGIVRLPSDVRPDLLIPKELERLTMRCLAREPEDRPQTVRDIQQEIREYLTYKAGEIVEKDDFWETRRGSQPAQERDVLIKTVARVAGRFEIKDDVGSSSKRATLRGRQSALEAEARILRLFNHVYMPVLYDFDLDADGKPIVIYRPLPGKNLGYLIEPHPIYAKWSRDIAMEFVTGQPQEVVDSFSKAFDEWMEGPFLTLERIVDALLKACDALAYAHSFGIVHRHLKPTSVYVGDYGNVAVTDWGYAVDVRPEPRTTPIVAPPRTEAVGRLPAYSAPEILNGDKDAINIWTDVYGMGGLLYEALTGVPPHWQADVIPKSYEVLLDYGREGKIWQPSLQAADGRDVPKDLEDLVMAALSVDPVERPPFDEFHDRLRKAWKHL